MFTTIHSFRHPLRSLEQIPDKGNADKGSAGDLRYSLNIYYVLSTILVLSRDIIINKRVSVSTELTF
jgi:hypothetical protein